MLKLHLRQADPRDRLWSVSLKVVQAMALAHVAILPLNSVAPPALSSRLAPIVTVLSPAVIPAGSPDTTLAFVGGNFTPDTTVQWNRKTLDSQFNDSSHMTATVPASYLQTGQVVQLAVSNTHGSAAGPYAVTTRGVITFAAGPVPPAGSPAAVGIDPVLGRIYVVNREFYQQDDVNNNELQTNVLSVVDQATGAVLTVLPVGRQVNGLGQGIAVDPVRHRIFVPNSDDNTVSVIDGTADKVLAATAVDKGPAGIAVDPATGIVYVGCKKSITLLDAQTGSPLAKIPTTAATIAIVVDPGSHLAYALVGRTLAVVDGKAHALRSQANLSPNQYTLSGLAVNPGSRLYISDYNTGLIDLFDISGSAPKFLTQFSAKAKSVPAVAADPSTGFIYVLTGVGVNIFGASGVQQTTITGLDGPVSIVFDSSSLRAYIADNGNRSLTVIDTHQLAASAVIHLGTYTTGAALDSAANQYYAANGATGTVSVIDAKTKQLIGDWTSGAGTIAVAVDSALRQVYALNVTEGTLSIFSSADGSIKATLKLQAGDQGVVAVDSKTHMVYVSVHNGSSITAIDGITNQIAAQIAVGTNPVGIAIDEAAGRLYVANFGDGTISVVDTGTNEVTQTWKSSNHGVWKLAIDPALHQLYVTITVSAFGNFRGMEVLDSNTGAPISEYLTNGSETVAVNPATHHVFLVGAAPGDNSSVTAFDGATGMVLGTVVTGVGADSLGFDPDSAAVYVDNGTTLSLFPDAAGSPPATPDVAVAPESLRFWTRTH